MRKIRIILVFTIVLSFYGCPSVQCDEDNPDFTTTLTNDSDFDIYFHLKGQKEYPENYLYDFPPHSGNLLTSKNTRVMPECFSWYEGGKLIRIFIYKASTLEANDWETIKDNGLYDARFDLTLEELEAMNFEIVYTGM